MRNPVFGRAAASAMTAAALVVGGCSDADSGRNLTSQEVASELSTLRIDPGLWEVTSEVVEVRGPDLPREIRNRMVGPRTGVRHCIGEEQARSPSANFLAAQPSSRCAHRRFEAHSGRVAGEMVCEGSTVRMEGEYRPAAFEMRLSIDQPVPDGGTMTIETRSRGRRIGACGGGQE